MRGRKLAAIVSAVALAGTAIATGHAVAAQSEASEVTIDNFAFTPPNITVTVGTVVSWSHVQAGVPHTVTATDGSFDSGVLSNGDIYVLTFDSPVEFAYLCNIHPSMKGTVRWVAP